MRKIIVSKEAREDLVRIHQYIREELINPSAAQRIIAALKKAIAGLAMFPERGRPLDALVDFHTAYRYLLCEKYCIFYLCSDTEVWVVRILHQRQDMIRALFSDTQ